MDGVRSSDLDSVLSLLSAAAEASEPDALASAILPGVRALVECDSVAYNDLVLEPARARFLADPADSADRADNEAAARTMYQHPVMAYQGRTGDQTVRPVSDLISQTDLHRLDFYNDFWKALEVEYQLWLALSPVDGTSVHMSFQRERSDFTPREQAICELLRPHLTSAYVHAAAREAVAHLTDSGGRGPDTIGLVRVDRDGHPVAASGAARRLLAAYFPGARSGRLAEPLREWVDQARARERAGVGIGRLPARLDRSGDAGSLTVSYVGATNEREHDALLLAEEPVPGLSASNLRAAGLTERQAEALGLAVRRVPNDAIALELGISRRTVEKHLERSYRRLGVSSRGEAVRLLRR